MRLAETLPVHSFYEGVKIPELACAHLSRFHRILRKVYMEDCFKGLETTDFSAQLVSRVASWTLLFQMKDLDWDDWGKPSRIVNSLKRIGRKPNSPAELATLDAGAPHLSTSWDDPERLPAQGEGV